MAINPRQNIVIIKGEDHTGEILRISQESERTIVTFKNGKSYRYSKRNVEILSHPERVPTENYKISIKGDVLSDVEEVLRFKSWVKIFHGNGECRCCNESEVSAQKVVSSTGRSSDILAYYRELAEGSALRTDEDESLLAKKYRQLNVVSRHSILSSFLKARIASSQAESSDLTSKLIFPFGCNMSQKAAIQKAYLNPASLIQGPPGTGKTQTILNLIGNLVLEKKRVAVVSNNNSATANVLEKLQKYELDFMAAFLGSAENKKAFIDGQTGKAVMLPMLKDRQAARLHKKITRLNQELDRAFRAKNNLVAVIQNIDALKLEREHFQYFQDEEQERNPEEGNALIQSKVPARKLLDYWLSLDLKRRRKHAGFLEKIRLILRLGFEGLSLLRLSIDERITALQKAYYTRKLNELERSRKQLESSLRGYRFDRRLEKLTELSMQLMRHRLAERYNKRDRKIFELKDLWQHPENFLEEYPVILSTTFSVITSVKNGYLFDCIIVDEASQVDLLNGALAMACAKKLVIVGDPMQLPNVLTDRDKKKAEEVGARYDIPDHAQFTRHSLLSAVNAAFKDIPETLLREHYRCHPKIIEFCNQKFYGGELLIMKRDEGEADVIKAYMTVEGRHERDRFNQRQIDEIIQHVLPELGPVNPADIGIVSPYRAQTARMREFLGSNEIEVDTVHKYQGREKRVMIISTVSNEANDFVDDPNLLNVAISRAQEKLRIVVSKDMAEGNGNIADFVRYIRYSNCEVIPGRVRSVFDLLYREYTQARLSVLKRRKRISIYDSENLAYGEIEAVLQESPFRDLSIALQFPLSVLVNNTGYLTPEESKYAAHPATKADFLIYRRVDKYPVLVIEVDGYAFHHEGTPQAQRDILKDSVLHKCGLPILRLSTTGSNERPRIRKKLADVVRKGVETRQAS